jgi:hypothetical protein
VYVGWKARIKTLHLGGENTCPLKVVLVSHYGMFTALNGRINHTSHEVGIFLHMNNWNVRPVSMEIKLECFPTSLAVVSQLLTTENGTKFQANLGGTVG